MGSEMAFLFLVSYHSQIIARSERGWTSTDRQTDGLEFQLINHIIRLTPPGQTDG